jgi:hypothetical protein
MTSRVDTTNKSYKPKSGRRVEIFNDTEYLRHTRELKREKGRHRGHRSLETPGSGQSLMLQVPNHSNLSSSK